MVITPESLCPATQALIEEASLLLTENPDQYTLGQLILRRCLTCEAGVDLKVTKDENGKLKIGTVFIHGHCRQDDQTSLA